MSATRRPSRKLLDLLIKYDANDPDVLAQKIEALYAAEIAAMEKELRYAAGLDEDDG